MADPKEGGNEPRAVDLLDPRCGSRDRFGRIPRGITSTRRSELHGTWGAPGSHQSTGYDVTVDASGAALGPTALVRTPELTSPGNVTGGISGRTVDFTINWSGSKAYVHFTGTVGNDGVAHGTSTGTGTPVKLDPGPWDSVTQLTC